MNQILISPDTTATLRRLRPPSGRSSTVVYTYALEGNANPGYTLQLMVGEAVLAPGAGRITKIEQKFPSWRYTGTTLTNLYEITIDHGNGVQTTTAGLGSCEVVQGQNLTRGDRLGLSGLQQQVFLSVKIQGSFYNPISINRHFVPRNNTQLGGQRYLKWAPDRVVRDLSRGVISFVRNGVRYFSANPYVVNIDFTTGSYTKAGQAATGIGDGDFWNPYYAVAFTRTDAPECSYYVATGGVLSGPALVTLYDYQTTQVPVVMERVAPLQSDAGDDAMQWDNLIRSWVGGYSGAVPVENTFRLHGMGAGTFDLYLYANEGATTFYASVNDVTPAAKSNSPTVTPTWLEDENYVRFRFTLSAVDYIYFKAIGYLSGLQLVKLG